MFLFVINQGQAGLRWAGGQGLAGTFQFGRKKGAKGGNILLGETRAFGSLAGYFARLLYSLHRFFFSFSFFFFFSSVSLFLITYISCPLSLCGAGCAAAAGLSLAFLFVYMGESLRGRKGSRGGEQGLLPQ